MMVSLAGVVSLGLRPLGFLKSRVAPGQESGTWPPIPAHLRGSALLASQSSGWASDSIGCDSSSI